LRHTWATRSSKSLQTTHFALSKCGVSCPWHKAHSAALVCPGMPCTPSKERSGPGERERADATLWHDAVCLSSRPTTFAAPAYHMHSQDPQMSSFSINYVQRMQSRDAKEGLRLAVVAAGRDHAEVLAFLVIEPADRPELGHGTVRRGGHDCAEPLQSLFD